MADSLSTNQRKIPRTPYIEEILVTAPQRLQGRSIDIGAGGIALELTEAYVAGTRLTLQIFQGHLIVQGTVRWCRKEGTQFKVGLQFDALDWSILERVGQLTGEFPNTA